MCLYLLLSSGYDVQSANTPDRVLYITGAPRYNHTGRVVIYRLMDKKFVISQTLKGEQVSFFFSAAFGWSSAALCYFAQQVSFINIKVDALISSIYSNLNTWLFLLSLRHACTKRIKGTVCKHLNKPVTVQLISSVPLCSSRGDSESLWKEPEGFTLMTHAIEVSISLFLPIEVETPTFW